MNTENVHANKVSDGASDICVFVVDDDPVMRIAIDKYLSAKHIRVVAIADGFDVLVALEKNQPDLIVSDIHMEKLDGLSLLEGLRNRAETKDIPVLFISSDSGSETMERARALGAKYFLIKPFQLSALFSLIRKILKQTSK